MGLDPPFELFVQSLNRIRCADRFPLAFREAREGEEFVARFLQALCNRAAFHSPFANERLALDLDLRLRGGIDHMIVIGGDFLVQPVGRMSKKVAMLMHRTPLDNKALEHGGSFVEAGAHQR